MTPQAFIAKWSRSGLKERSAAQSHFNDVCRLVGVETPAEADPTGEWFCFEKGARKTGGGDGWADVWRRGCFGWEYKGPGKDMDKAFQQLQRYAVALENPPLLVVSDTRDIIIHTNFTNTVSERHVIRLEEIGEPENLQRLRWLFTDPGRLRPGRTIQSVTEDAARRFADIAARLREAGGEARAVAHFVNRLLFCMFAEDIGLLPNQVFTRLLEACQQTPERFQPLASQLFAQMRDGGFFGVEEIPWFNGGLFDDDAALPMDAESIRQTLAAARLDWSDIEPSIFGTLFERGLDPAKRGQLGAHYTDADKIMRIIEPVVLRPLEAEWRAARAAIAAAMDKAKSARSKSAATRAMQRARAHLDAFLERLGNVRVLDPACGSGNFLYLALRALKDMEHRALLEAESLGLGARMPGLGPEVVRGIEINPYAAELARVTVWIGQIQWMIAHGYSARRNPVLQRLDTIECRDALIDADGGEAPVEAEWPEAGFIVGNPPFLGDKKMVSELGEDYAAALRACYSGRVPAGADLVTYWFEKARAHIAGGRARRAGLVTTNSIRGGRNREVLARVIEDAPVFEAWSDEAWTVEGAAVRVSLVCFGETIKGESPRLDGREVPRVHADLSSAACDLTRAARLPENAGVCFMGASKKGPLDIPGELARAWLRLPNPHGRPNSDVLKPLWNALDVTRRPRDVWAIDFGCKMSEAEAALYEAPFQYALEHVKPVRAKNRREAYRKFWWRFGEARPAMRQALRGLSRYIATPAVAKHRLFVWLHGAVLPDQQLLVIARDDDVAFGILHSRFHELWALRMCTWLGAGNDPRYTPSTTFETFPFPPGFRLDAPAPSGEPWDAIADAARGLVDLRERWLNPPEWVERAPEVAPGLPDRRVPRPGFEARLKKRTLTNLYNERPAWLAHAHAALDAAVARAYGWDDYAPDMPEETILARLFELNQSRAGG